MARVADLERELGLLIRRSQVFGRLLAADVHPDLDPAGYATLVRIQETTPARASDLADYFGIDKSAISRQLRHLASLGLIERTVDAEDARARALTLTAEGNRSLTATRTARRARFRRLFASWSESDVDTFTRLLGELNDAM